jgi:glycosyltransferase involved in cell wall biosynthesis
MSHCPAISVIMPVYNTAEYLREAIDSVLDQTFRDFELIIVDDGSTDGSVELVKTYSDSRIILVENDSNNGICYALNVGISLARGQFLARMDSDDICLRLRFEKQMERFFMEPELGILGSSIYYYNKGEIVDQWTVSISDEVCKIQLLTHTPFAHPTVMFNTAVVSKCEIIYDQSKFPAEDYDLWTRLVPRYKVSNIDEKLLLYRTHNSQVSFEKRDLLQNKLKFIREYHIEKFYCYLKLSKLEKFILIGSKRYPFYVKLQLFLELKYLKKVLLANSGFQYKVIDNFIDDLFVRHVLVYKAIIKLYFHFKRWRDFVW